MQPVLLAISIFSVSLTMAIGSVLASKQIFEIALKQVMRGVMSYFDTTPSGRILSRLGKDVDTCDNVLPFLLRQWLTCLFSV